MDRSNAAINRILDEAADLVGREKEAIREGRLKD